MRVAFCLIIMLGSAIIQGQETGHRIEFIVDNYDNDTLVTGYYYGDRQLVHDSLFFSKDSFVLQGEESLKPGMYLALFKPNNDFIQFVVPEKDQFFQINIDRNNLKNFSCKGSDDNQLFIDYIAFISEMNREAAAINEKKGNDLDEGQVQAALSALNEKVIDYQLALVEAHPESITAKLISVNREVQIPNYTGTEEEMNTARYRFLRNHYFDYLDLADPVYGRLPYTHNKITTFVEKLTPQHPDSISQTLDMILKKMDQESDFFKFYLSHFLNKYVQSNVVGMDAVYVHLVDNYYGAGKASWVDEETLEKIIDNANMLKPTLIGKIAPDVITFKEDGTPTSLFSVDADYTILYIYAFDCGHCKKSTPPLVEFYDRWKDRGVSVFTICSKREIDKCWEYTKEKKMDNFINTVDPYNKSGFRTKFDVRQTPKIFILSKDKEILLKNFNTQDLDKIMEEIIKMDLQKS